MREIDFQKFTSYGNNFIIVDETQGPQLREDEKSSFACQVTNVNYGIGADGVLFLQPYRSDILADINATRHYWDRLPVYPRLDIMFRIFEPNGTESFSCGNGLMCMANFLNRRYNIASTPILTQLPTQRPEVITIGTDPQKGTNWANMGSPGQVSQDIVNKSNMTPLYGDIDIIDDISIAFRLGDLHPFSNETSLDLTGFLVYTGEPHFVIFPETGFSINELSKVLFLSSQRATSANEPHERRITFGSWLINHIGMHLNKRYAHIFPNGINVNFVHIPTGTNVLEYRCFERGINKETLACGTGALAVSFVAQRLKLIKTKQIAVWPHRSRWYDPDGFILIDQNKNRWSLYGKPVMLLEGKFMLEKYLSEQIAAVLSEESNHCQNDQIQEQDTYHSASLKCSP
ncbi:MAG: diaminopimelate epimerase [Nitrospinales bacterium]